VIEVITENITLQGKSQSRFSQAEIAVQNMFPGEKNAGGNQKPANLSVMPDIISSLQRNIKALHDVGLNFSIHNASGNIMITVVNEDTGEVIREIPSSEMLNLAAKLEEAIGLLFDKKV
jgi:uncharacterized FlaG/YvyC family protein